jgi:20S proteasome subunit beta 3
MGDPTQYNGGAIVAMAGKNCFAIASDMRLGEGFKGLSFNVAKVHPVNDSCVVGLPGLRTDQQTFLAQLTYRLNMYKLREEREISGRALSALIQSMLYEKRFGPYFTEPVVASLDKATGRVYLCATDLIGAPCEPEDYVCSGTCSESLQGMCEAMWRKDMDPEELFETISQCMLSSCDRDCLSGYGATVIVVTADKVVKRLIHGRKD